MLKEIRGSKECDDSVSIGLPEQFLQPHDVDGDPARLFLREHLRLQRFGRVVSRVQGERLTVCIPGAVTAWNGVGVPWSREPAW
jgi:hypothetical protein